MVYICVLYGIILWSFAQFSVAAAVAAGGHIIFAGFFNLKRDNLKVMMCIKQPTLRSNTHIHTRSYGRQQNMLTGPWPGNPYQNIYMTSHMLNAEIVQFTQPSLKQIIYEKKMLNGP